MDPSLRPAAVVRDTEDSVHALPVDRRRMAVVNDTAADDADVHMQEEEDAAGGILRIDSAAVGGVGSHRLEEVGLADVHNCHAVLEGPKEEGLGEVAEAADFLGHLANPVETVVAAAEGQPVGEAEDPREAAAEVGWNLHLHLGWAGLVRAVHWPVVEAMRVAWEASRKAEEGEQPHWQRPGLLVLLFGQLPSYHQPPMQKPHQGRHWDPPSSPSPRK